MNFRFLSFFRKNRLIVIIFVDALVIAAFIYGVLHRHQLNQTISQEIIDERTKQDLILDRGVYLASQNWQIDFGGADRDVIASSFIPKNEALSFITQLETLADNVGLQPHFELAEVDPNLDTIQKLPLKVSASGPFQNVLMYLMSIEKLPYYIQIQDVRFEYQEASSDQDPSQVHVQLIGTFMTFWH